MTGNNGFLGMREKLHTAFTAVSSFIKKTEEGRQLHYITQGIDLTPRIIGGMCSAGWSIEVTPPSKSVTCPPVHHSSYAIPVSTPSRTEFSAYKENKEAGSLLWYRDLCKVINVPESSIPNFCRERREPTFMDILKYG